MSENTKRISIFLPPRNFTTVQARAVQANMTVPAYLRSIAMGEIPTPRVREKFTVELSLVARDLERDVVRVDDVEARKALENALERVRRLLKDHVQAA